MGSVPTCHCAACSGSFLASLPSLIKWHLYSEGLGKHTKGLFSHLRHSDTAETERQMLKGSRETEFDLAAAAMRCDPLGQRPPGVPQPLRKGGGWDRASGLEKAPSGGKWGKLDGCGVFERSWGQLVLKCGFGRIQGGEKLRVGRF